MKRFHRPFFALLFSLLLIGSQQAAFAHLLTHVHGHANGHVRASATANANAGIEAAQLQGDHGSIDGAAETCTTCIAFAGVGSGAPPTSLPVSSAAFTADNYCLPRAAPVFARPVVTCRARAPPLFL